MIPSVWIIFPFEPPFYLSVYPSDTSLFQIPLDFILYTHFPLTQIGCEVCKGRNHVALVVVPPCLAHALYVGAFSNAIRALKCTK